MGGIRQDLRFAIRQLLRPGLPGGRGAHARVVACLLPAWRATRAVPVIALGTE